MADALAAALLQTLSPDAVRVWNEEEDTWKRRREKKTKENGTMDAMRRGKRGRERCTLDQDVLRRRRWRWRNDGRGLTTKVGNERRHGRSIRRVRGNKRRTSSKNPPNNQDTAATSSRCAPRPATSRRNHEAKAIGVDLLAMRKFDATYERTARRDRRKIVD